MDAIITLLIALGILMAGSNPTEQDLREEIDRNRDRIEIEAGDAYRDVLTWEETEG